MSEEFDLTKVYSKILSKKEVIKYIKNSYDKEFLFILLPRTKDNADIIIRSVKLNCKECVKQNLDGKDKGVKGK